MVRKTFLYIFIYTLLVGCNTQNPLNNNECESDFIMNVEAPELEMDENGYYHIEWLAGYNQTFATLEAVTNTEGYNKIYWGSDSGVEYNGEFVTCVNTASYTTTRPTGAHTSEGVARQVMAVWEEIVKRNDFVKIVDGKIIYVNRSEIQNDYTS